MNDDDYNNSDCSWWSIGQVHSDPSPGAPACSSPRQGVHDQDKEKKGEGEHNWRYYTQKLKIHMVGL